MVQFLPRWKHLLESSLLSRRWFLDEVLTKYTLFRTVAAIVNSAHQALSPNTSPTSLFSSEIAQSCHKTDKNTGYLTCIKIITMKLLLALLLTLSPALASDRIDQLKNYLGQRDQIARIYMPQQITEGEQVEVLVQAPGAESVTILGSRSGEGNTSNLGLHLGADAMNLATSKLDDSGRATVALAIPAKPVAAEVIPSEPTKEEKKLAKIAENKLSKDEKKAARKAKRAKPDPDIYYIEAILTYPDGLERRALNFGANAAYIGFNGMRVVPVAKDNAGAANMAKSFVPAMAGLPVGSY